MTTEDEQIATARRFVGQKAAPRFVGGAPWALERIAREIEKPQMPSPLSPLAGRGSG